MIHRPGLISNNPMKDAFYTTLASRIQDWGLELGFQQIGISDIDLSRHEPRLQEWLDREFHGSMRYMSRHGLKRSRPAELVPGTIRVISARMDYLNIDGEERTSGDTARVSRYALGRDYHKVLRNALKKLQQRIAQALEENGMEGFSARVFTDSAPVLEKALAEKAGLGWIAKNTLLVNRKAGSWFFLGEIFTNLPLPVTGSGAASRNHCGSCRACIDVCPTGAIVAPYQLDASRCISYLTIENRGPVPEEYRRAMGNRIFGCDDCQTVCPWNRYATPTEMTDFLPRHGLHHASLLELFAWSEEDFLQNTLGSAIRRAGYKGWIRNIAIALGNAGHDPAIVHALREKLPSVDEMVAEHIAWAIREQEGKALPETTAKSSTRT